MTENIVFISRSRNRLLYQICIKMRHLIAVLCFMMCVKAQNTTIHHDDHMETPLHPSMAVVLVVLLVMFSLIFLILAYAKFCHGTDSDPFDHHPGGIIGSRPRFSGMEKTIIESLPYFRFSSLKGSKEGLDCAVCLSRFEDAELLRLLPKCRHAFHLSCIDKWLEIHSSCPLCRCKFEAGDMKSLRNSNSFRFPCSSGDEPSLEFFIQREQSRGRSLRFNLANTLQKLARGRRDDPLIREFKNQTNGAQLLHNVKHRIIVSDVIHKRRWSDVNSSDLLSLDSEMLNVMSREGPSSVDSRSGRFNDEVALEEQILKIKEDMERKRLFESKIAAQTQTSSGETSRCHNDDLNSSIMSKPLDPAQKRSMSEITNISRFTELNSNSSRISSFPISVNSEKDDKVRRLWLPMARRTIQWFSGQETSRVSGQRVVNV